MVTPSPSNAVLCICFGRFANGPCEGSGWSVLHEGATHGGCEYVRGTEICKAKNLQSRFLVWQHGSRHARSFITRLRRVGSVYRGLAKVQKTKNPRPSSRLKNNSCHAVLCFFSMAKFVSKMIRDPSDFAWLNKCVNAKYSWGFFGSGDNSNRP